MQATADIVRDGTNIKIIGSTVLITNELDPSTAPEVSIGGSTISELLNNKQDTLVPGDGITIDGNTIDTSNNKLNEFLGSVNVQIGENSSASDLSAPYSVSIGYASSSLAGSVSIGTSADAKNKSISIGANSKSSGLRNIAIGNESNSTNKSSIAIGYMSKAYGDNSVSIGPASNAKTNDSVAIGYSSTAENNGISIGSHASSISNSIQIGYGSNTTANTVKIWDLTLINEIGQIPEQLIAGSLSKKQNTIIAGYGISMDGARIAATEPALFNFISGTNIRLCKNSSAGPNAYAIGVGASATGKEAIAIGTDAIANADNSIQIGRGVNDTPNSLKVYNKIITAGGGITPDCKDKQDKLTEENAGKNIKIETLSTGRTIISALIPPVDQVVQISKNPVSGTAVSTEITRLSGQIAANKAAIDSRDTTLIFGTGLTKIDKTISVDDDIITAYYMLGSNTIKIGSGADRTPGSGFQIAVGSLAKASSKAIAIGYKAKAEYENAIVIGGDSKAMSDRSILVGSNTTSYGIAIGSDSSSDNTCVVLGNGARSSNANSISIGNESKSSNTSIAIGSGSVANRGSVAIGNAKVNEAQEANVIKATGEDSIAILGDAINTNSIAIGINAYSSSQNAISISGRSLSPEGIAIGHGSVSNGINAVQIGKGENNTANSLKFNDVFIVKDGKLLNGSDVSSSIDSEIKESDNPVMNRAILKEFNKLRAEISAMKATSGISEIPTTANASDIGASLINVITALKSSSFGSLITVPDYDINTFDTMSSTYNTLSAELLVSDIGHKVPTSNAPTTPEELVNQINQLITNLKTI